MSAAATAPDLMSASVYRGAGRVVYEQIGVPAIGPGEILVKVAACGICHTDLKKIEYDLLTPPRIYASDRLPERLAKAEKLGAMRAWDPTQVDIASELRAATSGRGADVVIVAASAPGIVEQAVALTRPGARIMLFAQTSSQEKFELDGAGIGKNERMVFGSYSASVDLQRESAEIVWREDFPVEDLISHRLPLAELERGIEIARRPQEGSLKVLVYPQEQD